MDDQMSWSVTDRDLHERLRSLWAADVQAAIATVVDVEGSAYRRPGAKLVAPADSETLGAITAGCLDGPIGTLATQARESGTVSVETFDLTGEEWGVGLGCNGVIDVLVEPLDDSIEPLLQALARGDSAAVLTVLQSDDETVPVGARTVLTDAVDATGEDRRAVPTDALPELRRTADAARAAGSSTLASVSRDAGDLRVFVDGIEPAPELLLFGAQQDVNAIADFGARAGFRVTVASPRGARSDTEQFPRAHRVCVTHPTETASAVEVPDRTYAVVLSHNLVDDRLALEALLDETSVPYIGLMGPRKRFEALREEAAADGRTFTEADLDRISTPVGLNLGAGSPTGIAMSIVSEVLAEANGTDGGRLSDHSGPIHPRSNPSP